jgi:hypothetical protein
MADLTYCRECRSKLRAVHPIMEECHMIERPVIGWHMVLRCGNCMHVREVDVTQRTAEAFDLKLDKQRDQILDELERRERGVMKAEAKRFIKALRNDHIVPFDFH